MNNIPPEHVTIFNTCFGGAIHSSDTRVFTKLSHLVREVSHVDLLDIDAQGGEQFLVTDDADRKALSEQVRQVTIETHETHLDRSLPALLQDLGFAVEHAVPMTSQVKTRFGTVFWRGGRVTAMNGRYRRR